MAMQTDVKSAFKAGDGAVLTNGRTRLKGIFYAVTTAGDDVILYDNAAAASGTVAIKLPGDVAGQFNVVIPGEGILLDNGLYADAGAATGITVFYG